LNLHRRAFTAPLVAPVSVTLIRPFDVVFFH
jgi:hypothetical protein